MQKCNNCNGVLVFDIDSKKMFCNQCFIFYDVERNNFPNINKKIEYFSPEIYKCPDCGAKIKMRKSDTVKGCIFCGQQTILQETDPNSIMSTNYYVKPDYILTFSLTEEEAKDKVKTLWKKYNKKEGKCKIISIQPVYMPYALYDINIKEKNTPNMRRNVKPKEYLFEKIPVNISNKYIEERLLDLEQFNFEELVQFDEDKIVDCYAELIEDVDEIENKENRDSLEKFLEENIAKTPKHKEIWDNHIISIESEGNVSCKKRDYVLLPVWFVTVEYEKNRFFLLVNGQNGTIVGEKPLTKSGLMGKTKPSLFAYLFLMIMFFPVSACVTGINIEITEWAEINNLSSDWNQLLILFCVALYFLPFIAGYYFFRKVLYSLTKDKVLEPVLKKPHSSNYVEPKK